MSSPQCLRSLIYFYNSTAFLTEKSKKKCGHHRWWAKLMCRDGIRNLNVSDIFFWVSHIWQFGVRFLKKVCLCYVIFLSVWWYMVGNDFVSIICVKGTTCLCLYYLNLYSFICHSWLSGTEDNAKLCTQVFWVLLK